MLHSSHPRQPITQSSDTSSLCFKKHETDPFKTKYLFSYVIPCTDAEVKTRNKAKRSASSVGKLKSALLTSLRINDAASVKSIRDRYSGKGSGTPRLKR